MAEKQTLKCICEKQACWRDTGNRLPAYCDANNYLEELEESTREYPKQGVVEVYKASCAVHEHNGGMTPRIEEVMLYARELGLKKIGFAACVSMADELGLLVKLFTGAGFEVYAASCQMGGIEPEKRGVPEVAGLQGSGCNPIAQAAMLNKAGTELNLVVGLCLGHDILFNRYSKAPVSTLIVKDRAMGNNPAAALYGYHRRKELFRHFKAGKP